MKQSTRERFEEKFINYGFGGSVEGLKQNLSLDDVWSFIETIREEALKEGEEMGEKIGIAKCINLIPEQKAIVPLGGDNKYYAGYNAGIRLTRDNFDKYFKSL